MSLHRTSVSYLINGGCCCYIVCSGVEILAHVLCVFLSVSGVEITVVNRTEGKQQEGGALQRLMDIIDLCV